MLNKHSGQILVGARVTDVETVEDYLQITFDNGARLSVFNRYAPLGLRGDDVRLLISKTVARIEDADNFFSMHLTGSVGLRVGLEDADYVGPEAMYLTSADGRHIVWP